MKWIHSLTAALGCAALFAAAPAWAFDPFTPMQRSETIASPRGDLADQQTQTVRLGKPIAASLITVNSFGASGWGSMHVSFALTGGGRFALIAKEGMPSPALALPRAAAVEAVSVRCDSFSSTRCRYEIDLVGE